MRPDAAAGRKLAPEALYEYAVRALGRRAHTEAELERKLQARAAREESVAEVLGRLRERGWLDDERTAESHSHYRREYDSLGRRRVVGELRRRGIADETAERIVEETYAEADESELIRRFLRRKLGRPPDEARIDDRKALGRLYRSLFRAGFSPAGITAALSQVSNDAEWLEAMADAADFEE